MNILVTGGAGFIGSHLVPLLLAEGNQVTVLDNLSSGKRENVPEGAAFLELDMREEKAAKEMAKGYDAIVHLAAQTAVASSLKDPRFDADENIMGLLNVLEAAKKGGSRVIFASSAATYGDADLEELPLEEDLAQQPLSFYGLTKTMGERYLELYGEAYGLSYAILRFANVYGERQGDGGEGGVISIFTRLTAKGDPITIHGDGYQTRDFIYAGDIARGIWAAVQEEENLVCNLSSQTEKSLLELVELLGKAAGKKIEPRFDAPRKGDIYRSSLSNRRAGRLLSWKPEVTLADGLRRVYDWQRSLLGR